MEYHVWRQIVFSSHLLAQVLEYSQQFGVDGVGRFIAQFRVVYIRKVAVFHYEEFCVAFRELPSGFGEFQQSVVFNVAFDETGNYGLIDYRIQKFGVGVLLAAEFVDFIVMIRLDFGVEFAQKHIYHIF